MQSFFFIENMKKQGYGKVLARFKRYNKVYRKKQAVILHENEKRMIICTHIRKERKLP